MTSNDASEKRIVSNLEVSEQRLAAKLDTTAQDLRGLRDHSHLKDQQLQKDIARNVLLAELRNEIDNVRQNKIQNLVGDFGRPTSGS